MQEPGPREVRDFWRGLFLDSDHRRRWLVQTWVRAALTKGAASSKRLADLLEPLLRTILHGRLDFQLFSDHCALYEGLPVPLRFLTLAEREFLVRCVQTRRQLWRQCAEGRHGELACINCVYDGSMLETYEADGVHRDLTWRRWLALDACRMLETHRSELAAAIQAILRRPTGGGDLAYVQALHWAVQRSALDQLPCWGLSESDAHPEVRHSAAQKWPPYEPPTADDCY